VLSGRGLSYELITRLIKKPRGRGGHSPRWAAEPEMMIMMMIIMIIIIIIIIELLLSSHCNVNEIIYLFVWCEVCSTGGGHFVVAGFCDGEKKREVFYLTTL
jgi:hypothetical protein